MGAQPAPKIESNKWYCASTKSYSNTLTCDNTSYDDPTSSLEGNAVLWMYKQDWTPCDEFNICCLIYEYNASVIYTYVSGPYDVYTPC